jgi:putative ABC transport system permease protein
MIRVTLRGLLAHGWRAALTSLAAVVGVAVVAGTLMVSDTADRRGATEELDVVRQIMLLAGGVAILVGAFVVNLTMSITVAQRSQELALLRCVGADKRQLRRSVLLEALLLGLFAALAGLVAGFGVAVALRALINTGSFPGHLPGPGFVLSTRTIVAVFAVGVLATALSALAPARRAGQVAPVAALHAPAPSAGRMRNWRIVVGMLALAGGLAMLPIAVATWQGPLLVPGAALTLLGVRLLGPLFAGRVADTVGVPFRGVVGGLGRRNAARSPDRTAATAATLMIGLALLTLINVLFASVERPMLDDYHRDHTDFQVWTAGADPYVSRTRPTDPEVIRRLRVLPELSSVVVVNCFDNTANGAVCAADPAEIARVVDLEIVHGSLTDLSIGGVGVSEESGYTLGAALPVGGASIPVKAVYRANGNFDNYLMTPTVLARTAARTYPGNALLRVASGVDMGAARGAVLREVASFPDVEVHDRDEFHEHDLDQIRGAGAVYRTLTGLAALVGLFGVASTLALSVVERRRELGLLRAVGMQRRQVRSMVRAEGVIVALVGAALGLAVGTLFGWATAEVLSHSSQPTVFTLPIGTLAACVPLVALAGLLASAVPARLAGRVGVLRAISTE